MSDPTYRGALLGATDLQDLAFKSPFFYTLNILEAGEEVNRDFGYGLIADQCRRDIKILKRKALALDGIPSEFWGTVAEVYKKQSAELAIERNKAREAKASLKEPQELFDWGAMLFEPFTKPDLNKGIFWYANQMAYGRVKIAPIDWNCGFAQDNFERAVEQAISNFKASGLRETERHVPLMTRLAYRFGLG